MLMEQDAREEAIEDAEEDAILWKYEKQFGVAVLIIGSANHICDHSEVKSLHAHCLLC